MDRLNASPANAKCVQHRHGRKGQSRAVKAVSRAGRTQGRCLTPAEQADILLKTVPGGTGQANLEAADRFWSKLCNSNAAPPEEVLTTVSGSLPPASGAGRQFDVVVLGGTLGIFLATALQLRGWKVAVIERNRLVGREQEWNISRSDMKAFTEEGILTLEELEEVIVSSFNPVRVAFEGVAEILTEDILNCGVSPKRLLEVIKQRFLTSGGVLMEGSTFQGGVVHDDGVRIQLEVQNGGIASSSGGAGGEATEQTAPLQQQHRTAEKMDIQARVLVDAMGSFSPIANQSRGGQKPDSVVLMVGSCAQGLPECSTADLLYSFTPLNKKRALQYFWETFPAADGLTSYMFCYADPVPGRTSLRDMFEDYAEQLPKYRSCSPDFEGVKVQRAQFGVVPNWHGSPPRPATARLLHVGDSAGNRSALSFAGFGAMSRHLTRLRRGLEEALNLDLLDRDSLQLLQPKSPAINMTAAMQFSMGTRTGQRLEDFDENIINDYIGNSFRDMKQFGPQVYRPFMQDFLQWGSLSKIVFRQLLTQPGKLVQMTLFMRSPLAGKMFASNFAMLFVYDLLYKLSGLGAPFHEAILPPKLVYKWRRLREAFEFGSASDYKDELSQDSLTRVENLSHSKTASTN